MAEQSIRPLSIDEFVGQEQVKEQARAIVGAAKLLNEPIGHTLLTGPAGLGKTSFAGILAKEREVDFVPLFSSSLRTVNDMREILRSRLNDKGYVRNNPEPRVPSDIRPTVLFIDEVHRVPKIVRESLYTVMEDRVYWDEEKSPWSGRKEIRKTWVPKFSLIVATTNEGSLEKPFLDRFENHWKFSRYTPVECQQFVTRAIKSFPVQVEIQEDAIENIGNRARGTARVAINLTRAIATTAIGRQQSKDKLVIDNALTSDIFEKMGIDENGLIKIDYDILKYLAECYRPTGIKAIAAALEEDASSIERIYEPFLVSQSLVQRTPSGRVITQAGIEYLRKRKLVPPSTRRYIGEEGEL